MKLKLKTRKKESMAKKRSFFASKILLTFACITSVNSQYPTNHHTTYGSPFAVPSHDSSAFLSPIGASSLSSVLTAMGLSPPTSPSSAQVSRSFSINSQPSSLFSQGTNPGNPTRRQSPSPDPTSGQTTPLFRSSVVSPQISNALSSRIEPPPTLTRGTSPTSNFVSLDPSSISLLNNLVSDLLNPSVSSPFTTSAGQMPFIVLLPETGGPGNQPTGLITNSNQNFPSINGQSLPGNPAISDLVTFLRGSGITADPQPSSQSGNAGSPQIVTVPSQEAGSVLSTLANIPNDTPVLVLLDPSSLQGDAGSISSNSQTGTRTPSLRTSGLNNPSALDLLTALAQSFPPTPTTGGSPGNRLGSVNRPGSARTRNLPPFPGTRGTITGGTTATNGAETGSRSSNPSSSQGGSSAPPQAPPSPMTRIVAGAAHSSPAPSPGGSSPGGAGNSAAGEGNAAGGSRQSAAAAEPATGNSAVSTGSSTGNSATSSGSSSGPPTEPASSPPRSANPTPPANTASRAESATGASQPSNTGGSAVSGDPSLQGDARSPASSSGTTTGGAPPSPPARNSMQMIIPVLDRGAGGGIYMYSFTIESPDGVTRHETGEVAPGIRKISRTLAPGPAVAAGGSPPAGASGSGGGNAGASGATGRSGSSRTTSGTAAAAGSVTDLGNLAGNYSYHAPDGKVLRVHYTHGPPTFVPRAPPALAPSAAPHPFDFLLSKLGDLRLHHQLGVSAGAPPAGAPPADAPPADAPPADAPPADVPPADVPPADAPPADAPPADVPPADAPPADAPPADAPPADAPPADAPPADAPPADAPPAA